VVPRPRLDFIVVIRFSMVERAGQHPGPREQDFQRGGALRASPKRDREVIAAHPKTGANSTIPAIARSKAGHSASARRS
jgi:hypothetical protein